MHALPLPFPRGNYVILFQSSVPMSASQGETVTIAAADRKPKAGQRVGKLICSTIAESAVRTLSCAGHRRIHAGSPGAFPFPSSRWTGNGGTQVMVFPASVPAAVLCLGVNSVQSVPVRSTDPLEPIRDGESLEINGMAEECASRSHGGSSGTDAAGRHIRADVGYR